MDIVLLVLLIIVIILLGVNIFINIKNKPSNSFNENDIKVIEQIVKNALNQNIDRINDKPNDGFICKTFGRLAFKPYLKVIDKYYKVSINKLSEKLKQLKGGNSCGE